MELAREKAVWPPLPTSGFRRRGRLLESFFSLVSDPERDFTALACLRRPLTARLKADWFGSFVGEGSAVCPGCFAGDGDLDSGIDA